MKCPKCESEVNVRKIIYGELPEGPDPTKYIVGGCCMEANLPGFTCIKCGWEYQTEVTNILGKYVGESVKLMNGLSDSGEIESPAFKP